MIVKFENDWKDIKNVSRTTVGKSHTENDVTTKFKTNMLISEHSPLRLLKVRWYWSEIKSWIATHFSRHKWECFITTNRTDRTGVDRDKLSQSNLVNFDGEANAQNLIDTARKRLCFQSAKETREMMESLVLEIRLTEPELASVLVPAGIYRCGCPEKFSNCTYCTKLLEKLSKDELFDIEARYKVYTNDLLNRYS